MSRKKCNDPLRFVREGECDPVFTTRLTSGGECFKVNRFLQAGDYIPVDDFIDTLLTYERYLCARASRGKDMRVGIDKELAERLILASVLARNPSAELTAQTEPDHTRLATTIRQHVQAYKTAVTLLKEATQPGYCMEDFVQQMETSSNVELTQNLLKKAGAGFPAIFVGDQPLVRLDTAMPDVLPIRSPLSIRCSVTSVSDSQSHAQVQMLATADTHSAQCLSSSRGPLTIRFGNDTNARADLLIAQLNEHELWLEVVGKCPTMDISASQQKTQLTLVRIQHEKTNTVEAYAQSRRVLRQLKLDLPL